MRKDAQIKFYKPMAVPTLMYGSKIWTILKRQKKQIVTAEIKFPRSVAGYTRKNQIRNTKIRGELNISNLNDKILRSRSQWNCYIFDWMTEEFQRKFQHNSKMLMKLGVPTVKMEWSTYFSRGCNRQGMG
jgi:hypothetical protein